MAHHLRVGPDDDYVLVDVGGGARLERFGGRLVDRPSPGALAARADPARWAEADIRFDRDQGWSGPASSAGPWAVRIEDLMLELRATEAGQVGLFPEHASLLGWLRDRTPPGGADGAVLNLFAYTGLLTLGMAALGASVTHVDSSRPTVAWARENARLSGLDDRPIRWIVDDARAFTSREIRRGRRYRGVILDPPSYGHGPGAQAWRIDQDLPELLRSCATLVQPDGFLLATAHTPTLGPDRLADLVGAAVGRPFGAIESGDLFVATDDGRRLELGAFARFAGGA